MKYPPTAPLMAAILSVAVAAMPAAATAAASATATGGYHVLRRIALGGTGFWDYLTLDSTARRLYVSHARRVLVLDVDSGKVTGTLTGLSGVHGVALDPGRQRGWVSNGRDATVTEFDTRTLKTLATIKVTGDDPDAILYDASSQRVFTFNGHSGNATAIDAATGRVVATIALPGKPEFAVSDGHGHVYANIEDRSELVEIDPVAAKVLATWSLAPGESPSGLAIDSVHRRLFSVCDNGHMIVLDANDGHRVADLPIGDGPDAARFDPARGLAYSSNGGSGTLTVVHEDDPDHFHVVATVPTQKSGRTMALDTRSGRVFVDAARFGTRPAVATADNPRRRPPMVPGSFVLLEVGR